MRWSLWLFSVLIFSNVWYCWDHDAIGTDMVFCDDEDVIVEVDDGKTVSLGLGVIATIQELNWVMVNYCKLNQAMMVKKMMVY